MLISFRQVGWQGVGYWRGYWIRNVYELRIGRCRFRFMGLPY